MAIALPLLSDFLILVSLLPYHFDVTPSEETEAAIDHLPMHKSVDRDNIVGEFIAMGAVICKEY